MINTNMSTIDINCDMGEWEAEAERQQLSPSSAESDLALMPFISSCSIACGGHIGDEHSMRTTVRNALQNGLRVGAHPAYPDKGNFGRLSLDLPLADLTAALFSQISTFQGIVAQEGGQLAFVKPHGALYNDMVKNAALADKVIDTIKRIDPSLPLMGLAGSDLDKRCAARGISFIAEAFADRRYSDNGELTSRSIPGSVIEDPQAAAAQILSLIKQGSITAITGKVIPLKASTLCVHSDTRGALDHIKAINTLLKQNNVEVGVAP